MAFITKKCMPRRTVLKTMGATVALPFLDAMVPKDGMANSFSASTVAVPAKPAM